MIQLETALSTLSISTVNIADMRLTMLTEVKLLFPHRNPYSVHDLLSPSNGRQIKHRRSLVTTSCSEQEGGRLLARQSTDKMRLHIRTNWLRESNLTERMAILQCICHSACCINSNWHVPLRLID